MKEPFVIWLDEAKEDDAARLGGKGRNLAALRRGGFRVPDGFCITPSACEAYLGFAECVTELAPKSCVSARDIDVTSFKQSWPEPVAAAIREAYRRLGTEKVAVRSSGLAEDQAQASYAGQQETFLNVSGEAALLDAICRCWASFFSERVSAYRSRSRTEMGAPQMAVVVQEMIPCESAGVAFSVDPVTGKGQVVIEAACGLGEQVVGGLAAVDRWTVDRRTRAIAGGTNREWLPSVRMRELAEVVIELERLFGCPQDVEWGWFRQRLYLLQSRPITVRPGGFLTEVLPGDDHLWTSGFLNERFTKPVSPMGWSLIRELLEPLAFRDPLRFMGYRVPAGYPLLKLFRGHPFANVRAFQVLYRPFPASLLPEDARRYFPAGRTELRYEVPYPRGWWDPRMWFALSRTCAADWRNWMPGSNDRHWAKFAEAHACKMVELQRRLNVLGADSGAQVLWELFGEAQALNRQLLAIHRWSLMHADLSYSLLRRLLTRWLDPGSAAALAPRLVSGLPNKSVELNRALEELRQEGGAWDEFAAKYGHRSFGLDVAQPTFAEMPEVVGRMAAPAGFGTSPEQGEADRDSAWAEVVRSWRSGPTGWVKTRCLAWAWRYAARYMPLREEQRFCWQKTLALQRCLLRRLGAEWVKRGLLTQPDDIFSATLDESRNVIRGEAAPVELWRERGVEYARLLRDFELAPQFSYPQFLRGNQPLTDPLTEEVGAMRGQPVSPGLARGPARIVLSSDQFDRVRTGDVLVARGVDPGWTPLFGRIAGLVMEVGGQLSHAAVIAREYRLPAVTGVTDATRRIQEGEEIVVDGLSGVVQATKCQTEPGRQTGECRASGGRRGGV